MRKTVSVITTVFNEETSIADLLESLLGQSRSPDEIVIVDAGSTDRTQEIIAGYIARGLPARLIVEPRASRSYGRNLAIAHARNEVIASIDAGCVAKRDWLEELLAPFEAADAPDIVSGYYVPAAASAFARLVSFATVPTIDEVDPNTFLPSSRSVAFTRRAWERAGGYPEYVDCAEDTLFDLNLQRAGLRFRFRPEALVRWRMQAGPLGLFRQFFCYARSDGELAHWFRHYPKAYLVWGLLLALAVLALVIPGHPRWIPIGLLLAGLAAYGTRYAVRARRRGASPLAAAASGLVSLTVDLAHVLGYTAGRSRRRPVHPSLPADRPLSIAQVTYTYQPVRGGADVYVSQLADLITAAGHRHVVYQRRAGTEAPDVRFVPNPLRGKPLEFWTQTFGLFRLWRELAAHDVVICHYPPYLLAIYLMSLLTRGPLRVGLSHGVFWDDAPGALHSRVKAWLARLAYRRAHLYIANDTEFLREMGLRIRPKRRLHCEVAPGVWFVPNGVDTEKFQPTAPLPDLRARRPILVPRNLFRNRGIHLAVEAFHLFRRDHPDTTLVIVGGGGQPEYVAEVQAQIARLELQGSVLFRGSVPHGNLPAIYSSARLTLIPSLCGEGTSLSALESMACRVATICTDVAGLKDLPGPHASPNAASLAEVMRHVYLRRLTTADEQRRLVETYYSLSIWRRSWRHALQRAGVPMPTQPQLPL